VSPVYDGVDVVLFAFLLVRMHCVSIHRAVTATRR